MQAVILYIMHKCITYGMYSCATNDVTFLLFFLQDEQVQSVVGACGEGIFIAEMQSFSRILSNHFARGMDQNNACITNGSHTLSKKKKKLMGLTLVEPALSS